MNSPGQNTGMGSLSLLQGIFPTRGLNHIAGRSSILQADSLPAEPQRKPRIEDININCKVKNLRPLIFCI